ncbi:DNA cytosine methyltransferase [Streptomyces sp. NPDC050560]|uniref:DNA cytosine methyltransferase n=1 Tax=Streptomyces sp. NPDC050560 TaxID=3365630 RepID=UPI0037A7CAE1
MRGRGHSTPEPLTSVEICAGAGGQAVGLHNAGFEHLDLIEYEPAAVDTLSANVSKWPGWTHGRAGKLKPQNVRDLVASSAAREESLLKRFGVRSGELSLFAGGVPCPPFSLAGKRLGADDDRDLFPAALEMIDELRPKAVMIENVRGILDPPHVFMDYRRQIVNRLFELGYHVPKTDSAWSVSKQNELMNQVWRRLDAYLFGVPQLRPRAILVAIRQDIVDANGEFVWPRRTTGKGLNVLEALEATMRKRCKPYWKLNEKGLPAKPGQRTGKDVFDLWRKRAQRAVLRSEVRRPDELLMGLAPTLVGGSRKHGGADLGPTRAKRAWLEYGVNAMGVANDHGPGTDPERDLFRDEGPMLTVEQAAIIQGFPPEWVFQGGKTARYRQVGNAFPPPVAEAVGRAIAAVLRPGLRADLETRYELDSGRGAISLVPEQLSLEEVSETAAGPQLAAPGDDSRGDLVSARR